MTDSVESVLQKLAEEISLYMSANQDVEYTPSPIRLRVEIREMLRSALEPTLAEREQMRVRMFHFSEHKGTSHTTACTIWREDGQGHAEGFEGGRGPCNCGALENFQRQRADAAEQALRKIGNTAGRPVAEYYSAEMQRKHFLEIVEEISKLVQQALSPSPTPAPDTNTQSLYRAKPSPDSATPPSSSSVGFPSLPPDDAAIHNARRGVISALPGTADRSKALDELVRAEMEDGTYWRIPCNCSESDRAQCKRCGGKGRLVVICEDCRMPMPHAATSSCIRNMEAAKPSPDSATPPIG